MKRRNRSTVVDPTDLPRYTISQAAYVIGVPESTLDRWFYGHRVGRRFSPRVIVPADADAGLLSFINLTEAHVLESIRERNFTLKEIREAVQILDGPHPLASFQFLNQGKRLFVRKLTQAKDDYQPAISVSRPTQGQVELGNLLDSALERITRDDRGLPFRLFPMRRNPDKRIVSDLYIADGEPVIAGTGILAQFVYERHTTGEETIAGIAEDYGIDKQAIEDAIRYIAAA